MKITYSAAASLDGFIARPDGDVSWLEGMEIDPNETGMAEFFNRIDGLVMGRKSYDFVFDYGSWPYEDKPTWVCTHHDLQPMDGANLIVVEGIEDVVNGATSRGVKHLWLVCGGRLASSFLEQGLITNLSIAQMPIELGSGIPLFADHQLEEIPAVKKEVTPMKGFTQIEILIREV